MMANPLDTLKKLRGRSLREIRVRGEQAIAARSEQMGFGGKIPSDAEFSELLDRTKFTETHTTPESLRAKFFELGASGFFQSFGTPDETVEIFRREFGAGVTASFIDGAERVLEGRYDLLGFRDLEFGVPTNWHLEPRTGKQAPRKHWKQFDELSSDETGDKKIIWELNRHQHFFTLGFAYLLTRDEAYAEAFAEQIDDWMEQNPPGLGVNWVSSLEVGLRAISWLWAFHFFKDSPLLSPELFQKALKFLYLHARHIEKYLSTYYSPNTHLTGEALALYYLGTQLAFLERSEHWRKLGEEILLGELDRQILEDGVYFELSTWYARYTADFYTHFLILRKLNGAAEDEHSEKLSLKLQKLLDFLMFVTRPDGTTPLVGDDDGGRSLPLSETAPDDFRGTLAAGAALFGRGDYKFVAKNLREEVVWLLGARGVKDYENLTALKPAKDSRDFPAGGYFVMRDGWAETDSFLLIDCGRTEGGHAHADTLAIEAAPAGRTLLADLGTFTYHESEDLRDLFRSTAAHNTLTVNGESSSQPGGKFGWETHAAPVLKSWLAEERFDFFEGAHNGFKRLGNASGDHTRAVFSLKNDYAILRDFVETEGGECVLNFHFRPPSKPEILETPDGAPCVSEKSAKGGSRLFTFDGGGWEKKEGWFSGCYGSRREAAHLQFVSQGAGAREFFTFLLATDAANPAPEVFEAEIVGGRAFVVNFREYRDIFIYADGDELIRTEFFDADFRFIWARLSEGESEPEEFVLVDGARFSFGGREIVESGTRLKFLTARRLGEQLNVRTNESIFSVALGENGS